MGNRKVDYYENCPICGQKLPEGNDWDGMPLDIRHIVRTHKVGYHAPSNQWLPFAEKARRIKEEREREGKVNE